MTDKQIVDMTEKITLIKSKLIRQAVSVKDPPKVKQAKAFRAKLLRKELACYETIKADNEAALP